MNLNLEQKNGICILKVSGEIDPKGTSILRAGITKLMKSGKDKIVLDVSGAGAIDTGLIAEIALLNKLATELTGKIIFVGAPADFTEKVKKFSSPAPFTLFKTISEAQSFLQESGHSLEELSPELQAIVRSKDAQISALENQLKLSNPDEIRRMRQEYESLMEVNRQMEAQIAQFIAERRIPPDSEAVLEKITLLERNMKEMSSSMQAGGNAKK